MKVQVAVCGRSPSTAENAQDINNQFVVVRSELLDNIKNGRKIGGSKVVNKYPT